MSRPEISTAFALGVVAALFLAGCGDDEPASSDTAAGSQLQILLEDPEGAPTTQSWSLGCNPPSGDLEDPAGACETLEGLDDPWAPVPADVACAEIFGGPQILTIRGEFGGETVDATFSRSNACEIERFDVVANALGIRLA